MTAMPISMLETSEKAAPEEEPTAGLTPIRPLAPFTYHDVILLADILDDTEGVRIANQHRYTVLTAKPPWGKGMPKEDFTFILDNVKALKKVEDQVVLQLQKAVKKSPLAEFVASVPGLGEKSLGRFVGAVGDPAWHYRDARPRKLSELRSYCGLSVWHPPIPQPGTKVLLADADSSPTAHSHGGHSTQTSAGGGGNSSEGSKLPVDTIEVTTPPSSSPAHGGPGNHTQNGGGKFGGDAHVPGANQEIGGVAPYMQKGRKVSWSPQARTALWKIAQSMKKKRDSAYREVYDAGRLKYADAVHTRKCVRCGPRGKPALPGSPLADGHKDARADRLVMRAALEDIWKASRKAHEWQ